MRIIQRVLSLIVACSSRMSLITNEPSPNFRGTLYICGVCVYECVIENVYFVIVGFRKPLVKWLYFRLLVKGINVSSSPQHGRATCSNIYTIRKHKCPSFSCQHPKAKHAKVIFYCAQPINIQIGLYFFLATICFFKHQFNAVQ